MIFYNEKISPNDQQQINDLAQQNSQMPSLMSEDPQTRSLYDQVIAGGTHSTDTVQVKEITLGGITGLLITPPSPKENVAIMYTHGGGYIVGSANGYQNYVTQLAVKTNITAFIPNYALAPENKFPKANKQLLAVYADLKDQYSNVIIVGDSAGGGLALSLTNQVTDKPLATVAMSPWTDMTMSSNSVKEKRSKDFLLGPVASPEISKKYSGETELTNAILSPLFSQVTNTVPTLIHVGTNEILLDDSLRYANKFANVNLFVWQEMFHVFPLFEQFESSQSANQLTVNFILAQTSSIK